MSFDDGNLRPVSLTSGIAGFDDGALKPVSEPEKNSALRRVVGDTLVSVAKGVVGVPEAAIGLADIPTFGAAGKFFENTGVRTGDAKKVIESWYSDDQKKANERVANADGFVGTGKAMLDSPSTIAQTAVESVPLMLGGGAVARGMIESGAKLSPLAAGAIGEGAVSAGSMAESVRQQTDDGLLTPKQSAASLAAGVGTGVIGLGGATVAKKLGIGEVDTLLAGGSRPDGKGVVRSAAEGAVVEGALQEMPQSMQEQAFQNIATDRPVTEGVGASAAAGLLAGGVIGGVAGPLGREKPAAEYGAQAPGVQPQEQPVPAAPAGGALSRAAALLPAPEAPLALPAPEQVTYVDGNGVAQNIGPVRNVDGEMRPEPQARVPSRAPVDMAGGRGMYSQAPEGTQVDTIPAEEQRRIDRQQVEAIEQERADRLAAARVDEANRAAAEVIQLRREQNQPDPEFTLPRGLELADKENHGRWLNEGYRGSVEALIAQLEKGGGVAYVRDKHDRIVGRTPSSNPMWWQNMDTSVKPGSVEEGRRIVDKALEGKSLGPKQARFVAAMMDIVDDIRLPPQQAEQNRAILQELEWAASGEAARNQADVEKGGRLYDVEAQDDAELYAYLDGKVEPFRLSDLTPDEVEQIRAELIMLDDTSAATAAAGNNNDTEESFDGTNQGAGQAGSRVPAQARVPVDRRDDQETAAGPEGQSGQEFLTTYTEQDLQRRAADQARQDANAAEEQSKSKADDLRDSFTLTGSDRAADVGAAAGQGDLLSGQQSPVTKPALIAGADIDGDWTSFSPESGTLQVPRADMPQIKAEHRGAMVNFLNARNVSHEQVEVPAADLKPTQAEFSRKKVAKAKKFDGGDRSILISSDGHVLDGHHQWMAKRDEGDAVKAIRLNAPIAELLPLAHEFPSSQTAEGAADANQPSRSRANQNEDLQALAARAAAYEQWKQEQKSDRAAQPDPEPVSKKLGKGRRKQTEAMAAQADYFTPGNVVKSYDGHDRVVSYTPPDSEGRWSVTVRAVRKDGDSWVDVEGQTNRTHMTPPDARNLKSGPVGTVPVQSANADVTQQLSEMNQDDLAALIDEVAAETAAPETSKPKAKRSRKAVTAEGKPRVRKTTTKAERTDISSEQDVSRTAGEIAKSLGVNMSGAGMNALEGLTKLFGGPGRLNSGLSFDEETYAKAKPHFAAALADIQAAGKDLRDFIRALVGQFGDGVKPYILRFAQDIREEQAGERTDQRLEPDSAEDAEQGTGGDPVQEEPAGGGRGAGQLGDQASGQGGPDAAAGVSGRGAAASGERGDSPVDGSEPGLEGSNAGTADGSRGRPSSTGGLFAERDTDAAAGRVVESAVSAPAKANIKASNSPGTVAEIKAQMPFLTDGQVADIVFAEQRLMKPDGHGVLFTNGTGTGKTFTGLGIVARSVARGKDSILIITPKQTINDAWVKAGKLFFGVDITPLQSTSDNGGTGVVVATYANVGDNPSLARREWDLVIPDEAHYLSSAEDGSETKALAVLRALTRRRGTSRALVNLREHELVAEMKALRESAKARREGDNQQGWFKAAEEEEAADAIQERLTALYDQEEQKAKQLKQEDKPRGVFLSATPFAYEKNVQWAQEFLFDWGVDEDGGGSYNSGGQYERFMMQHFGYRMRYNKLTAPDANVDRGLMQRAFNAWLKKEGALSSRALDSKFDYDRRFVTVDSSIGRRVDEALKWLWDQSSSSSDNDDDVRYAFQNLNDRISKESFNYHARMYFLEAIKGKEAVPYIRAHLDAGRKVLVMHDFKKGGVANPFRLSPGDDTERKAYRQFAETFPDLISAFDYLPSPITQLTRAFPDALVYNGSVSAKNRIALQNLFNSDADDAPRVIIAQGDAMREGVSIHDTSGKFMRVLVHLGMPVKPTAAIQQEGRIYRTGQASDALFRYFTIGTSWERSAFASTIAGRAGTAENLAMGEQARGLKQAFITAYENAGSYEPGYEGEGKGGKADDLEAAAALTPWDSAKSFYFGTKKQGKGRSARGREGLDYFATPEPVGLKMVEWADIRGGESVLEPSVGHGAIGRWFPENSRVRAIEQSADLASRAALHVNGDIVHGRFEDHNIVNKYDAIVMNPPYGLGGAVAIPHLIKATEHLREGGRVVALIPTGPAADKRFEKWFYGQDGSGKSLAPNLHLVGDVRMPRVTFERAGTEVPTRIVVIEKAGKETADKVADTRVIDLANADSIEALFDRLENIEMAARAKPIEAEAEQTAPAKSVEPKQSYAEKAAAETDKYVTDAPVIEHVTGKGKVLRGVIVRDLSVNEVKDKFYKYAFKKDGGVFLREEFIERPDSPMMQLRGAPRVRRFIDRGTVEQVAIRKMGKSTVARQFRFVSFSELPPEILDAVAAQGMKPEEVRAIHWRGKTYLVDDRFRSEKDAAQAMFHEHYAHYGLRAKYGAELRFALGKMLRGVGGLDGVKRLAASQGIDLELYEAGMKKDRRISAEQRSLVMMEELLAHMAESTGSLKRVLQEFVGLVRNWLRSVNYPGMAELGVTDLAYELKMARRASMEVGSGDRGDAPQFSLSGMLDSAADVAAAYGGYPAWQAARAAGRTKLNYRQWVQVRTPEFKAWFGDWENGAQEAGTVRHVRRDRAGPEQGAAADSKTAGRRDNGGRVGTVLHRAGTLTDPETGEPRVFYHGTSDDITAFDLNHPNRKDVGWLGRGVYVASDARLASTYANIKGGSDSPNVMPLFVRSVGGLYAATLEDKKKGSRTSQSGVDRATQGLLDRGLDGAYLEFPDGTIELATFDPTNVKSATGNNGGFDGGTADIRFSLAADDAVTEEALRKLGLLPEAAKSLTERVKAMTREEVRGLLDAWGKRSEEGLFDGLNGIKKAEEAVGVTDPNKQGYVSARLATGVADVMHAVMHYGAPEWQDGIIGARADTKGLLDILADLGAENLQDWLGWVGGQRAKMLKDQGRENNLSDAEIAELIGLGKGKEQLFESVYQEYAKINEAVLDVAQGAGLLEQGAREKWATDYYVPFYRVDDEGLFSAPRGKKGLSHQSAGIKALKGGNLPTNDLLENILTNWTRRIDASLKNKALLEVVDNLKGSEFLTDESVRYTQAIVPRAELAKRIRKDRKTLAAVSNMLGMPEGSTAIKVAGELMKPENKGFEKLWAATAPSDPDIIRVQRGGRNEYYKVNDESLLRGLKHMAGSTFNDPVTRIGRAFKRLLTTGVTAAPDFILRNFIRDAAHAWVINKDGYKFGVDSLKGLRQAFAQDSDYRDLMFAGSSFQGGYVHGNDPEAAAHIVRRALDKKGLTKGQRESYMQSLVTSPAQMAGLLKQGWEKYREGADRVENSQRLATYKAALAAGKSRRQAAYEAKDLMDYSLRGNFAAAQWFTDVVPFLNARMQGLYKLGRAMKGDRSAIAKEVALKGAYLAAFSLLLAAMNGDDDRYKELPEWDKDMNWHLWLGDQHFRIPKPFELGLIFGTIPERMLLAATGEQTGGQLTKAVARGVFETLAFNPVPQFYQPIREVQANRDFFRDRPIENMADEGKLPAARYDDRTSAIGKALGQLTGPALGISPKQLDHLVQGYTGTLGGYVLSLSSLVADLGNPGERPDSSASRWPVLKVLYGGSDPRSTQYHTDFYDMLSEADQIYRTVRSYREEGRMEEAAALMSDQADKLKHRRALGMARQQFGAIRKRMGEIYDDSRMSGAEKRRQLNALQLQSNEIAARMVRLAGADF